MNGNKTSIFLLYIFLLYIFFVYIATIQISIIMNGIILYIELFKTTVANGNFPSDNGGI